MGRQLCDHRLIVSKRKYTHVSGKLERCIANSVNKQSMNPQLPQYVPHIPDRLQQLLLLITRIIE